jgi:hypothetical protein
MERPSGLVSLAETTDPDHNVPFLTGRLAIDAHRTMRRTSERSPRVCVVSDGPRRRIRAARLHDWNRSRDVKGIVGAKQGRRTWQTASHRTASVSSRRQRSSATPHVRFSADTRNQIVGWSTLGRSGRSSYGRTENRFKAGVCPVAFRRLRSRGTWAGPPVGTGNRFGIRPPSGTIGRWRDPKHRPIIYARRGVS